MDGPDDLQLLDEHWPQLESGFQRLLSVVEDGEGFTRPYNNLEYMTLYKTVYDLSTRNKLDVTGEDPQAAEVLYERYSKLISDYLMARKDSLMPGGYVSNEASSEWLRRLVKRWTNHKVIVRWMEKLFAYLDRYYTTHNNKPNLRSCGLKCFYTVIYEDVRHHLFDALFESIQAERLGESVDRGVLKEAVNLFIEMGMNTLDVYAADFETPFLAKTAAFYQRESSLWIAEDSATEFMRKAEDRLLQEQQRATSYLHHTSEVHLIQRVEAELLTVHQKTLLEMENSGFVSLLRDMKFDDMSRMYRLFKRIPKGLDPMAVPIKEYCSDEGSQIVRKHSEISDLDVKSYIDDLLALQEKYINILNQVLKNENVFIKAIKDAFEHFVNAPITTTTRTAGMGANGTTSPSSRGPVVKGQVGSPELLSRYCDMLIRSNDQRMNDTELDEIMERVVNLFSYIQDKDLFQEFYRKQLSSRLLNPSMVSSSEELERALISKLKLRCGAPYTSRLEGMLQDKCHSADLQTKFKSWQEEKQIKSPFQFTIQVLTTGFWPAIKADVVVCPELVMTMMKHFEDYYFSTTRSRLLKWIHHMGSATVNASFKKGAKEFSMTLYQALVLVLFNGASPSSVVEQTPLAISAATGISMDETRKCIACLSIGKFQILNKRLPDGTFGAIRELRDVKDDDVLAVNEEFTDKSRKLRIPRLESKVNPKATAAITSQVEDNRKHAIEACVVRLMKSRKTMEHSQLVAEAIAQLSQHFAPDPKVIKRRIEDLIAREYLERDPERLSLYRYLA